MSEEQLKCNCPVCKGGCNRCSSGGCGMCPYCRSGRSPLCPECAEVLESFSTTEMNKEMSKLKNSFKSMITIDNLVILFIILLVGYIVYKKYRS